MCTNFPLLKSRNPVIDFNIHWTTFVVWFNIQRVQWQKIASIPYTFSQYYARIWSKKKKRKPFEKFQFPAIIVRWQSVSLPNDFQHNKQWAEAITQHRGYTQISNKQRKTKTKSRNKTDPLVLVCWNWFKSLYSTYIPIYVSIKKIGLPCVYPLHVKTNTETSIFVNSDGIRWIFIIRKIKPLYVTSIEGLFKWLLNIFVGY